MVADPPSGPLPPAPASPIAAVHGPFSTGAERSEAAPALDGRQIFFLFVGSALAACLIFALGVTIGRRIEQHAAAQKKIEPADPLAVLDEIANAEEALTFHRAVLDRHVANSGLPSPNRFTLQSASFALRPAAEELSRRLREAGYKVKIFEVAPPGQKPVFRLQIGDYAAADGALPLRSELLSRFGLPTTVAKIAASE